MAHSDIDLKILAIVMRHSLSESEIENYDLHTPIADVGTIDSLSLLKAMVAIENEFQISFDSDQIENIFYSVKTISVFVKSRLDNRIS